MKKCVFPAALLLIGAGLSGCPIYDHDDTGCYYDSDCAPGYSCDDASGSCYREESDACRRPSDCGANETCNRSGTCVTGDCHFDSVGCVRGYECSSDSGRWECVDQSDGGSGSGGNASEAGAPATAGAAGDASGANGGASGSDGGAAGQSSSAGAGG
jgi:hypothetical protein